LVGEYFVDQLSSDVLLVELTTDMALDDAHRLQCTNYAKATGLQLCLLLDFGKPRLESNAWATVYEPRRIIGVLCVHRLSASATKISSWLRRHGLVCVWPPHQRALGDCAASRARPGHPRRAGRPSSKKVIKSNTELHRVPHRV
jgi:PD-(D/E)XK nuclease superfamily